MATRGGALLRRNDNDDEMMAGLFSYEYLLSQRHHKHTQKFLNAGTPFFRFFFLSFKLDLAKNGYSFVTIHV